MLYLAIQPLGQMKDDRYIAAESQHNFYFLAWCRGISGAINACIYKAMSVSYTHLTLPTILRV